MTVTIYTQPNCRPCEEAKAFLKGNNIEFEAKDVRADVFAMDELIAMGMASTPVIVVAGEAFSGWNEASKAVLLDYKDRGKL